MFLLLGLLGICISLVKLYVKFLCKDIKQLASSLTAVAIHASISTRTHFSISPVLVTVLLNICLLLLSNQSELNIYIKILSTFSYIISFDRSLIDIFLPLFAPSNFFSFEF